MSDYPKHPLQALLDGMGMEWQRERAKRGLTLGGLIAALEGQSADRQVQGLGELLSYRGYYEDLAFAPTTETRTVGDLLTECRAAMGRTFQGYKGGDFVMGEATPLWVAGYGDCGDRLMALNVELDPMLPVTEPEA